MPLSYMPPAALSRAEPHHSMGQKDTHRKDQHRWAVLKIDISTKALRFEPGAGEF